MTYKVHNSDPQEGWEGYEITDTKGQILCYLNGPQTRERDKIAQSVADAMNAAVFTPTHKHVKRGTNYKVLGEGQVQTETLLFDTDKVIIYVGEDGKLWAREPEEFNDGRFEEIK